MHVNSAGWATAESSLIPNAAKTIFKIFLGVKPIKHFFQAGAFVTGVQALVGGRQLVTLGQRTGSELLGSQSRDRIPQEVALPRARRPRGQLSPREGGRGMLSAHPRASE